MRPYGKTLRYLRQAKGASLQETYLSCMSRTTAYHLERGERELTLEAVLLILENLGGLPLADFLKLHEKLYPTAPKNVQVPTCKQLFNKLTPTIQANTYDYSEFLDFYRRYQTSIVAEERFFACYAHFIYLQNQESFSSIQECSSEIKQEMTQMVQYLLALPEWTSRELGFCIQLEPYFPPPLRQRLRARWQQTFPLSYYEEKKNGELDYVNNLLNFLHNDLIAHDWSIFLTNLDVVETFFEQHQELYLHPNFDCRLLIYQALRASLAGDTKKVK